MKRTSGSVKKGENAVLTVTAFPNRPFDGTVSQVRVNPTTVQNVVTYDAVVLVHDTSGSLLPGMTAQVNIEVGKRVHVLAVPIAAVLYRPLAAPTAAQNPASAFGGGFGAGVSQSTGGPPAGQAVAGAPGSQVTLWLLRNGRPVATQVVIGLSDGKYIEIASGPIAQGDQVIVAQYRGAARNGRPAANDRGAPAATSPSVNGAQTSPSAAKQAQPERKNWKKRADAASGSESQSASQPASGGPPATGTNAGAGQ